MGLQKEDAIKRIDRYLQRNDSHPRLVNVNNADDLEGIRQHFNVGKNILKSVEDFSKDDENLSEDVLYNYLGQTQGNIFLLGFTSYCKLFGDSKVLDFLNQIIKLSLSNTHLVVFCYQCEKYLKKIDLRYQQFVYMVDGQNRELPKLTFAPREITRIADEVKVHGVQNIATTLERNNATKLQVVTQKRKASYPLSLYPIKELRSSYEVLCKMDVATQGLEEKYGTEEEWNLALEQISQYGSWMKWILKEFTTTNLGNLIGSWKLFDSTKKWLCFIALKLYGAKNSWCLTEAIANTKTSDMLVRGVFRSILALSHEDNGFWKCYEERKKLIEALGNPDLEVADYCAMVKSKEANALYYLTDLSKKEKDLVFENLATYSESFGQDKVLEILSHVYPALYSYLKPYQCKIPLLDTYFSKYKYQKVVNKVYPDFLQLVDEQAEKREFNLLLPARSEKLDVIQKDETIVYFMDAMGVEYLSYIMDQCRLRKLLAYVTLCHCELPSITSFNKEFVDTLSKGGAVFVPDKNGIKMLDDLKHHGKEEFDFTNNELPTYISSELEIISKTIERIATNLMSGTYKRAIMISDHGASRLSVLSKKENKWGSENNAEHSGRCCPVSEVDEKPSCAIEENGYWVLANYDRFKGGRKANVEVHGGATLEEVVIPIIEFVYSPEEIEIQLLDEIVKFSKRKKNAVIHLFSKIKLDNLSIQVSSINRMVEGTTDNGQNFEFNLPELRKSGTYTLNVYYNNNLVQSDLKFKAENSDFSEKKLL